mgnify:CR=1 FL=1|tara:strand:+ start:530 stop:694 length:165 start_codon:yes stop_codon:yes gene_type:complete
MTKKEIIHIMRMIYSEGDSGYRMDYADYSESQMDKAKDLFNRICRYALNNRIPK